MLYCLAWPVAVMIDPHDIEVKGKGLRSYHIFPRLFTRFRLLELAKDSNQISCFRAVGSILAGMCHAHDAFRVHCEGSAGLAK